MLTFARLLQQISTPLSAVASRAGLEQALIVAQQIDRAEGALGPGGRIEQYQVVLALLQARIARQLLPAPMGDGQARQLANGREVIGLYKLHARQLRAELAVFTPHCQVALGKVQVAHLRAPPAAALKPTPQV